MKTSIFSLLSLVGPGTPSPIAYAIVPAVLLLVTLASCYAARRAARVDPIIALRCE